MKIKCQFIECITFNSIQIHQVNCNCRLTEYLFEDKQVHIFTLVMGCCCRKTCMKYKHRERIRSNDEDNEIYHFSSVFPEKLNQTRQTPINVKLNSGNVDTLNVELLRNRHTGYPRLDERLRSFSDAQVQDVWTVTELTPSLYLCAGFIIHYNPNLIHEMGITCIINATHEMNRPLIDTKTVEYIKIRIHDTPNTNIFYLFKPVSQLIEANTEAGGKTLIHCTLGKSRSASLYIAYFMTCHDLTYCEALGWVKSNRFIVNPNRGFRKQLREYEKSLEGCKIGKHSKVTLTKNEMKTIGTIKRLTWSLQTRHTKTVKSRFPLYPYLAEYVGTQ